MTRTRLEFIDEGKYAAEVAIELHYSDDSWSPTMSLDDARKLEAVQARVAARRYRRSRQIRPGVRADAGGGEVIPASDIDRLLVSCCGAHSCKVARIIG